MSGQNMATNAYHGPCPSCSIDIVGHLGMFKCNRCHATCCLKCRVFYQEPQAVKKLLQNAVKWACRRCAEASMSDSDRAEAVVDALGDLPGTRYYGFAAMNSY